jgi:uncharacterized protein YbjT (DUF2867 family)
MDERPDAAREDRSPEADGGMNVVIFGATGLIGGGVLRECLLDPGIRRVVTVGRRATGQVHPKLREIVRPDLTDLRPVADELTGLDACFFALGATSAGLDEAGYTAITCDLPMAIARLLLELNPGMTFVHVSGTGADSSEKGRVMWARVKGKAENALLAMPFRGAYVFRPAYVQPRHGLQSSTRGYRVLYSILGPLYPLVKAVFPHGATTTEQMGRAMIRVAREGHPKHVLESRDIVAL